MKRTLLTLPLYLAVAGAIAAPGDVYIYPAQGQSIEQLDRDRYECHLWARDETGVDPSTMKKPVQGKVVRVPVPANDKQGATLAGAVLGAVAGAFINDSSEGAAVGAAVGTVVGGTIEAQGQKAAEARAKTAANAQSDEQDNDAKLRGLYRRAFSACLEGRGYVAR